MGQRGAFGGAGGAAGELDVDGIVELQLRRQLRKLPAMAVAAHAEHVGEAQEAALFVVADADQRGQLRQALGLQFAGSAAVDFRRQLAQHADIVAGLERIRGDQRLAADLVERIVELGESIGRIDVDQDQSGLGGGELRDHPLGIVRRPDADAVAGVEPERQQSRGKGVDLGFQLAIAPAHALLAGDERVAVRPSRCHLVEMHAEGFADQRHAGGAVDIALRELGHGFSPGTPAPLPMRFASFGQRRPACHLI